MSHVLSFGGRRFVAGLIWERPGEEIDRSARRQWGWSVEWGGQTGWVAKDERLRRAAGIPSLAAALAEYLEDATRGAAPAGWVALLKADGGAFAVVRAEGGVIDADGDEVYADAKGALDIVDTARAQGAEVYATPGAVTDGGRIAELDVAALPGDVAETLLRRAGGGSSGLRVTLASMALLVVGAGGVWMLQPDLVMGLLGIKDEPEEQAAVEEAVVAAHIQSAVLVEGCAESLAARPPYMTAWRLTSIECHGWFEEWDLIGLRPELEGRPVMLLRWELPGHYVAALHRRIAEEHLAGWYLGSVVERSAWAVAPLRPVLVLSDGEAEPSYLGFRREVDRHLGMQGTAIEYAGASGAVTVRLGHGLGRIAALISAIPGFELLSLSRGERGAWVLEGRLMSGFVVKESVFRSLSGPGPEDEAAAWQEGGLQ